MELVTSLIFVQDYELADMGQRVYQHVYANYQDA